MYQEKIELRKGDCCIIENKKYKLYFIAWITQINGVNIFSRNYTEELICRTIDLDYLAIGAKKYKNLKTALKHQIKLIINQSCQPHIIWKKKLYMLQEPYIDQRCNDIPAYFCSAKDKEGNTYEVRWKITHPNPAECEDQSEMCNWDNFTVVKI